MMFCLVSFLKLFGRPFVKRFALCYHTISCLSVLSVTLVYCGQTVGWIKMKLVDCVLAVYTAVYMARARPCNGGVHVCVCTRLCTRLCTRPRTGRVGPCRRLCTCRVQGRGPCTRFVRSVLLRFSLQKTPFMPKR